MNNADILINRVNVQVGVFFGKEEVSSSILDIGSSIKPTFSTLI
jgi:hypothetical protein